MKLLIVLLVVLGGVWWWQRARRRAEAALAASRRPSGPAVQDMIACSRCGLHVPASDAVPGRLGRYCSEQHRAAAEQP